MVNVQMWVQSGNNILRGKGSRIKEFYPELNNLQKRKEMRERKVKIVGKN